MQVYLHMVNGILEHWVVHGVHLRNVQS